MRGLVIMVFKGIFVATYNNDSSPEELGLLLTMELQTLIEKYKLTTLIDMCDEYLNHSQPTHDFFNYLFLSTTYNDMRSVYEHCHSAEFSYTINLDRDLFLCQDANYNIIGYSTITSMSTDWLEKYQDIKAVI